MLSSRRFTAMGTTCQLLADYWKVEAATRMAEQLLDELDRVGSRARPDSELSRLERGSAQGISHQLTELLAAALRTAQRTEGLVDPTVVRSLDRPGDQAGIIRVREPLDATPVGGGRAAPGYWRILLDQQRREVLIPRQVDVDLGDSARAWAADRVASVCAGRLPGPFLVNLGGDIAVSGPPPAGGWQVAIDEAYEEPGAADGQDAALPAVVTVRHGGLATSSPALPGGRPGQRTAPVVDPRTGDFVPAVWRTVTVVAASCELANAASSAAVVLGVDAPEWLARRGLPARLVSADGRLFFVGHWPADAARSDRSA